MMSRDSSFLWIFKLSIFWVFNSYTGFALHFIRSSNNYIGIQWGGRIKLDAQVLDVQEAKRYLPMSYKLTCDEWQEEEVSKLKQTVKNKISPIVELGTNKEKFRVKIGDERVANAVFLEKILKKHEFKHLKVATKWRYWMQNEWYTIAQHIEGNTLEKNQILQESVADELIRFAKLTGYNDFHEGNWLLIKDGSLVCIDTEDRSFKGTDEVRANNLATFLTSHGSDLEKIIGKLKNFRSQSLLSMKKINREFKSCLTDNKFKYGFIKMFQKLRLYFN